MDKREYSSIISNLIEGKDLSSKEATYKEY